MHFIFFFLLWFIFSGTFYSCTKIFCIRNAILGKHFFSLQTNSTKKIIDQNVCCCNKPFVSWYFICKWPPFPHWVYLDIKSAILTILKVLNSSGLFDRYFNSLVNFNSNFRNLGYVQKSHIKCIFLKSKFYPLCYHTFPYKQLSTTTNIKVEIQVGKSTINRERRFWS